MAGRQLATFGAGCFWCLEAVLQSLEGVISVKSGYMGGATHAPDYDSVCSGRTGHAEVVQVAFNPELVQYPAILEWFWKSHDPTTLNRQGNDVGTQYRSAIFYHSEEQRQLALESREGYQKRLTSPIVTEIVQAGVFFEAEAYHQDFTRRNPSHPYVQHVIMPKLRKLGF